MKHLNAPDNLVDELTYLKQKCDLLQSLLEYQLIKEQSIRPIASRPNNSDEVDRFRAQVIKLEAKIAFLYNSFSWRVTKPLRSLPFKKIGSWLRK